MKMLRLFFMSCFFLFATQLYAQCDGERFLNMVFPEVVVSTAIPFGANLNFQGVDVQLLLDVYQPSGDTLQDRPLLILVHGGSFVYGGRDQEDVLPLCYDFARMGYVVASIDYRLGFVPAFDNLELPLANAVLRGVHDLRAAIRYFKKSVAEEGNPFSIDSEKIMVAGVSAGGFIALHHAYMDLESEIPEIIDQSLPGLGGSLEGNSGNPGYSSEVLGIVNIAGALKDTSWMQQGDEPVCNFHGTQDSTVPFGSDTLFLLSDFPVTEIDGSESIAERANFLNIPNCFEIHEGAGHVPHVYNSQYYDTTRAVMSNFLASLVCDLELDCEYRELTIGIADELTQVEGARVYPNPARDILFIEVSAFGPNSTLRVFRLTGELALETPVERKNLKLNLEYLPKGMYILELRTGESIFRERIIKN